MLNAQHIDLLVRMPQSWPDEFYLTLALMVGIFNAIGYVDAKMSFSSES